jgi:MazG family protein
MHGEMARQAGEFDLGDVYEHIAAKLIRRHPHVFGPVEAGGWRLEASDAEQASSRKPQVSSSDEVIVNWDAIKRQERASNGQSPRGLLDGIPAGLPALMAAQETIRKVSKAGFDTADQSWPWNKLHEEIDELHRAAHAEQHADAMARAARIEEEFGDLLLAASKLAYRLKLDAESALRAATAKFRRRFAAVERRLQQQGRDLTAISTAEKEALWREAKGDDGATR